MKETAFCENNRTVHCLYSTLFSLSPCAFERTARVRAAVPGEISSKFSFLLEELIFQYLVKHPIKMMHSRIAFAQILNV